MDVLFAKTLHRMLIATMRKYIVDVPGLLEGLAALVAFAVVAWGLPTWDRNVVLVAAAASIATLFVSTLRLQWRANRIEGEAMRLTKERLGQLEVFTAHHGDVQGQLHRLEERLGHLEDRLEKRSGRPEGVVELLEPRVTGVEAKLQFLERDADVVRNGITRLTTSRILPFEFYTAGSFDPEPNMLPILASHVSSAVAIDVGANRGEFTDALRRAGFEVDAFEPLPNLVADLGRRFAGDRRVRIHSCACSDRDGTAVLHVAQSADPILDTTLYSSLETHPDYAGLSFGNDIEVVLRQLDTVLAPQQPYRAGLLKIDTEGHDIAVLNGARNIEAEALMVEYWDSTFVFNAGATHNRLHDYLLTIDRNQYPLYIVIWRGMSRNEFGFIVGPSQTPRGSWGNILFVRERSLMDAVVAWARGTYGDSRLVISEGPASGR